MSFFQREGKSVTEVESVYDSWSGGYIEKPKFITGQFRSERAARKWIKRNVPSTPVKKVDNQKLNIPS